MLPYLIYLICFVFSALEGMDFSSFGLGEPVALADQGVVASRLMAAAPEVGKPAGRKGLKGRRGQRDHQGRKGRRGRAQNCLCETDKRARRKRPVRARKVAYNLTTKFRIKDDKNLRFPLRSD